MAGPEKTFVPRSSKRYHDVDTIKDVDGVVAVITRAVSNGSLAVGFFKEFDPGDGEIQRTAFCREKQLEAVERLIPLVRARMAELRELAAIGE